MPKLSKQQKDKVKQTYKIKKGCIILKPVSGINYVYNVWKETVTTPDGKKKKEQHWTVVGRLDEIEKKITKAVVEAAPIIKPKEAVPPRVGVYVCHCGLNIASVVDVKKVAKEAEKFGDVVVARDDKYMCAKPGQELIKKDIKDYKLNRVVVASCTPKMHEPTFRLVLKEAGLSPFLFEMANIREHDSWVHRHDPTGATKKAIDLVRMSVAKARLLEPGERITVPITKRAMVIGGGVAGIQAAFDLANNGFKVYLVEKNPTIGGRMAQLDKVFPTNDCSICILGPKMVDAARHPKITLLTYSEVVAASGYVGNFKVKVRRKPRYIDESACTGCGLCEEICPVRVPNEFDVGLKDRRAIYRPLPQAVPSIYTIDEENCIGCGLCKVVCEAKAIDFNQVPRDEELKVGTIVVATGYDFFDPSKDHDYGYGIYKNVITSIELERMFNSAGPTNGQVLRPSDGKVPKRVAFIQCVGSRNKNKNFYCSAVCCAYAMKEAQLIKEHHPDTEIYIFYIDIRTPAELEEYYERTQHEYGVKFVKGNVAEVYEDPKTRNLILSVEDTVLGKFMELEFDLVSLSIGLVPPKGIDELTRILGLMRSETGFFMPAHIKLRPIDTLMDGIFIAGVAAGPKDIPLSVSQGSGAAARASAIMAAGKFELDTLPARINPEKCLTCRLCEKVCQYRAVELVGKKPVINPVVCKACGVCAAACPAQAIEIPLFTDEQIYAQIREALQFTGTTDDLDPKIVGFCCNWCGYAGADHAGLCRFSYPTNIRIIRTMCGGRINPLFIIEAFKEGADGVMLSVCHPQDCHYGKGTEHCEHRYNVLRNVVSDLGLEPERLRLEYISAVEGPKLGKAVTEFVEQLKKLRMSPLKAAKLKAMVSKAKQEA